MSDDGDVRRPSPVGATSAIVEVHNNRHNSSSDASSTKLDNDPERSKNVRKSWLRSDDLNASADGDLQIHDQIKQGIMGFIENEIRKEENPKSSAKSLSLRPESAHRERKSPSRKRKKRTSTKHRSDRLGSDFDTTVSSMNALERVDDYLREYNKAEVVTLSGELEIYANDLANNNGSSKESKLKPRRNRRKSRHEDGKRDRSNACSRDISPRVFDPTTGKNGKSPTSKPVRPTLDLSSMLDDLGSDVTSYNERHIDNPFSSPSPMTSPNDGTLDRAFGCRGDKIYIQRGDNFRVVAMDRVLEAQRRADERRYFRLSSFTPLDVAIGAQRCWRGVATLCHGLLGGLALMHLLVVCYGDSSNLGHLSFHSAIILPYTTAYYFLCACCLVSMLDNMEINGFSFDFQIYPPIKGIFLSFLYVLSLLLTLSTHRYDEMMAFHFDSNSTTEMTNSTIAIHNPPEFYTAWSHLCVWRAIIPIVAALIVALVKQDDIVYRDLTNLLQFKHSLQSIGG